MLAIAVPMPGHESSHTISVAYEINGVAAKRQLGGNPHASGLICAKFRTSWRMSKSPLDERSRWIARRRLWIVFALVTVAIATVAFLVAGDAGRSRAIAAMRARAADAGTLALAILRGELEKQRALPVILARDPDVRSALRGGGTDRKSVV